MTHPVLTQSDIERHYRTAVQVFDKVDTVHEKLLKYYLYYFQSLCVPALLLTESKNWHATCSWPVL